jgi:hypothetical protein
MTLSKMPFKYAAPGLESALAFPERDGKPRLSIWGRLRQALLAWRERRRPNEAMWDPRYLDDRLLADIGLKRGEPAYSALAAGGSVIHGEGPRHAERRAVDGWDRLA